MLKAVRLIRSEILIYIVRCDVDQEGMIYRHLKTQLILLYLCIRHVAATGFVTCY